jgi:hypothetical protein
LNPERVGEVDELLADADWTRAEGDLAPGLIELHGDFDSDAAAIDQLNLARLGVESPTVMNLLPSDASIDIIRELLGPGMAPVGTTVVVAPAGEDSKSPEKSEEQGGQSAPEEPEPPPSRNGARAEQAGDPKAKADAPPKTPPVADAAQIIAAGLQAFVVSDEMWEGLEKSKREELSATVLEDLYKERSQYGQTVRWTFAPDAELVRLIDDGQRSALATKILQTRAGVAGHQVDLANVDVSLRKQAVALAVQDVEVRKQNVETQKKANELLSEVLTHLKRWGTLSWFGLVFLIVGVLFGMGVTVALVAMAWQGDISEWAIPAGIFALALFASAPAVLLLRERPLKGLDEASWPSSPQQPAGASGETPAPPAAGSSSASTVAFGQTNQPKAYGPQGRLRT